MVDGIKRAIRTIVVLEVSPPTPDQPSMSDGAGDDWLDRVFPFHFALDDELAIARCGPALRRLVPELRGSVAERFEVAPPWRGLAPDEIVAGLDRPVELQAGPGVTLRGQFTRNGAAIVFVGSPALGAEALRGRGLSLADRAPHDAGGALCDALAQRDAAQARLAAVAGELERVRRGGGGGDEPRAATAGRLRELRTQLDAVLGAAELLTETELTDSQRALVGAICGSCQVALGLCGDAAAPRSVPRARRPSALATLDVGLRRRIAALTEQAGAEVADAIIAMFLVDAPVTVDELTQAAAHGRAAPVARLAQTLRGSADNLGANGLADAAASVERAARSGAFAGAAALVTDLRAKADEVFVALRAIAAVG